NQTNPGPVFFFFFFFFFFFTKQKILHVFLHFFDVKHLFSPTCPHKLTNKRLQLFSFSLRQHPLVTNWNAILIFRVDFDSDACLFSDGQRKLRLSSHH
ncbi:hypothetical protein C4869_22230, partial [Salmonella enterica subsp. enterica serovar Anatum]|uniref:hypothetical protein n=1 Tax=Salmonella enterica TaxID=28901 RepID=UPI000D60D2C4